MCFLFFFLFHMLLMTQTYPPPPTLKAVSRLSRGGRPPDEAVCRGWKELPLFVSGTKGVITSLFGNNKSPVFYLLAQSRQYHIYHMECLKPVTDIYIYLSPIHFFLSLSVL